jgi:hypothetical protein
MEPHEKSARVMRARIFEDYSIDKISYSISELGAPLAEKVIGGRANPDGISYLYFASGIDPAILEVRSWKGASVNIATFNTIENLHLFFPILYSANDTEEELETNVFK